MLFEDEEAAAPKKRNLRELGRKRFRRKKSGGCNVGTDFHTGSSIFIGLGGCARLCVEGRNGAVTQEQCNSNVNNQKFTIQKASGDAMGFYIITEGGDCLQPQSCDLEDIAIIDSCGNDKARWAPAGGGMLFTIGCYESARVECDGGILAPFGGACVEENDVALETDNNSPKQVINFMSECAVRTVNGFS
jgi:hypothetical protein